MVNLVKPIVEHLCHCGNRTTGPYRRTPPTQKSTAQCCILCRCSEHLTPQFRKTDELPGCGAFCMFHHTDVRQDRIQELDARAVYENLG